MNEVIFVNSAFEDLFGIPLAQLHEDPQSFLEAIHPDDRPQAEQTVERLLDGQPAEIEHRVNEREDYQRWVSVRGQPIVENGEVVRIVGITTEITERKEREQQLQLFRRAVESSGHSIYFTDRNGSIEYVNEAFEETTGYTAEEALGRTPRILQSGEHDREFYEELWTTILDGDVWRNEVINERKDGSQYIIDQTIAPVTDETGEIAHFVAVNVDITDQKRTEERLKAFINSASDILSVVSDKGVVTEISPSAEDIIGYDSDEFTGETVFEYIHPEDRQHVEKKFAELVASDGDDTIRVQYRFDHADGSWHWLESVGSNCMETTLEGCVITTRDISKRKQRVQQLEQKNERLEAEIARREEAETQYRSLFENNPIVIWEEDLSEAKQYVDELAAEVDDLRAYLEAHPDELERIMERVEIVDVNENAVDYYGAESKTQVINNLDQVMGEEAWDVLVDLWTAIAAGETQFRGETVANTFDGERRHQLLELHIPEPYADDCSRAYITGTDITERKERERQLQRFRQAVEHAGHAVFITDVDGTIEYVNPAFEEITGYDAEEAIGRTPRILKSGEMSDEYYDQLWSSILDGDVWAEPIVNCRKSGEQYHADQTIAPIVDNGEVTAFVSIQADITERKEHERELQRQNEHLEEFASVVSHDLRNPLNVADGHLELAAEECDSEHLPAIEQQLERMETLIEDLLMLARTGKTVRKMEVVDLANLADQCWENVVTDAARLELDIDRSIQADRTRLQQLLENLFRNAVEHGGETVTVRIGSLNNDKGFYIEDDGPGIPSDDRKRVFESGYSTVENGTGFGLRIVEQIVDAHGWEITLTESDNGGARFEISGLEPAA